MRCRRPDHRGRDRWRSGEVLMVAHMNAEALAATLASGEAHSGRAAGASCGRRARRRATCCASRGADRLRPGRGVADRRCRRAGVPHRRADRASTGGSMGDGWCRLGLMRCDALLGARRAAVARRRRRRARTGRDCAPTRAAQAAAHRERRSTRSRLQRIDAIAWSTARRHGRSRSCARAADRSARVDYGDAAARTASRRAPSRRARARCSFDASRRPHRVGGSRPMRSACGDRDGGSSKSALRIGDGRQRCSATLTLT